MEKKSRTAGIWSSETRTWFSLGRALANMSLCSLPVTREGRCGDHPPFNLNAELRWLPASATSRDIEAPYRMQAKALDRLKACLEPCSSVYACSLTRLKQR